MTSELASVPRLVVLHTEAWRVWLEANDDTSHGVWLVLAKKGVTEPTSLTYAQALDEALCSGWIDGQRKSLDERTFLQRYTPRRSTSVWSQRNVTITDELSAVGRMRARGLAEIERAKADGRWSRAYAGQATAEMPADLATALAASAGASERYSALTKSGQYSILHPVITAPNAVTRANRIIAMIERLERQD